MLSLVACDSFREDFIEPEKLAAFSKTDFYTFPGMSVIIDLKSVIKNPFTTVSLKITNPPTKGILTHLDTFLLKYTPNRDFSDGADRFIFSVVIDNSTSRKTQTMNIFVMDKIDEFPCGVYAVEDQFHRRRNGEFSVDPLKNDKICGVKGVMNVSIHLNPKFGDAEVVGESIIYRPGPAFRGTDEMVYRLSSDGGEHVADGIISLSEYRTETFEIDINTQAYPTEIFFVNDTMGFIAGYYHVYKTNDGGRHWNLSLSTDDVNINFREMYFLDQDHGFVAFTGCHDVGCNDGGLMITTDGGTSWERINLGGRVHSIFFTSSLTGFIVTGELISPPGVKNTIHKTTDGGKTWNEVFTTTFSDDLKVRFVNDQIGYAYDDYTIFATSDGGKSWRKSWSESPRSNYVTSFALTSGNAVCASFAPVEILNGNIPTTTAYIARSDDGATWTRVRDFPYRVAPQFYPEDDSDPVVIGSNFRYPAAQGFSPDGDVGLVVTSFFDPPYPYTILNISTSTDKGETWVDYEQDLMGNALDVSVPSRNVAYILVVEFMPYEPHMFIIKYTP